MNELELQLELWNARFESAQNAAAALNAQAQLLQLRTREVQENIARVKAEIAALKPQGDQGATHAPHPITVAEKAAKAA